MQSIIFKNYGDPKVLQLEEVEKPIPKEHEVLIKIHATAVNDYDWSLVTGKPYLYRLMFGITKPKNKTPGMELSGVIEFLGENAAKFKVGDAVYGDISEYGFGSFAEYVCVNENALSLKPESMSFCDAASIPHAALLASQGLIDMGQIQNGQKVLINGAGGGMGTFGLYIAKRYSAEVTGVDTGEKLKMMSSIGYDNVIDYKQCDFTKNGQCYDLILDAKTNRSPFSYVRSLSDGGRYVSVGGELNRLLQIVVLKGLFSALYKKTINVLGLKPNKGLAYIQELYEEGSIAPVIDGPHGLSDVPNLIKSFGEGKHVGKIIISLNVES